MLKLLDIEIDKVVAFSVENKITEDDMNLALSTLKDKINKYGEVFIYEEIDGFSGIEISAIVDKFKYLFDRGLSGISRIAVVTNKEWIHKIVDLEDKLFKKIDMRCFSLEQKDKALEFLKQGE